MFIWLIVTSLTVDVKAVLGLMKDGHMQKLPEG